MSKLIFCKLGLSARTSSNFVQSVFLTRRSCFGSRFGPVVMSNMIYLWSEFENRSLTCQLLIRSPPARLVIVRSIIELCPRELRNVGVEPLLAQCKPNEEKKSRSSLPLSLQALFPHSVWCELVSDPTIRGRLLSLANFARGVDSCGGAGPLISIYDEAIINSVVSRLILTATWSGVVNCRSSQHLAVRFRCKTIAARGLVSPAL